MTENPSPASETAKPGGAPAPPAPTPDQRRIRPRDWILVAIVAALAVALTGYAILRPGGGDVSSGATSSASEERGGPSTDPAARPAPATDPGADAGDDAAGSRSDEFGVVDTMIQRPVATETGITDGETATRMGPFGDMARRIDGDPLAMGRVDAPVAMVFFSDYRCPFCALFSRTTEKELIEKYVDNGTLRIEWRDLPIFGTESTEAAIAGRAAAEQGMFWEYNSAIYAAAPRQGHPTLTRNVLIDFAKTAGIPDIEAFTAALDDPALAADVQADVAEGSFLRVPSTPAFVIDGYPLLGAQPLEEFVSLIDTVQTLS